ncbi:hypothetical protein MJ561_16825 [Klebsiella pneumoniae]|nr:hypothetical protein MJ561_16825 [Klebsiella pneumoniae]
MLLSSSQRRLTISPPHNHFPYRRPRALPAGAGIIQHPPLLAWLKRNCRQRKGALGCIIMSLAGARAAFSRA